ncbi:MAG: DNA polymerase III subunit epsilon, partial [Planktomarina sp.]
YLELIGGRQPDLVLAPTEQKKDAQDDGGDWRPTARPTPLPSRLSDTEKAAHEVFVAALNDPIWNKA